MGSFSKVEWGRIGVVAAALALIPPTILSPMAQGTELNPAENTTAMAGQDVVAYPGTAPGAPTATVNGNTAKISNAVISAELSFAGGPSLQAVRNVETGANVAGPSKAVVLSIGGTQYDLSTATVISAPRVVDVAAVSGAKHVGKQIPGKAVEAKYRLTVGSSKLDVTYQAILREGSNYIQQRLTFAAVDAPVQVASFVLFDATAANASVEGRDTGYPITIGEDGNKTAWIGVENPLAEAKVSGGKAQISMRRAGAIPVERPLVYTTTVGVSPVGQIRRAFLHYFERESTHARRTFLHYQSWFDLKPGDAGTDLLTMNAAELNHAIKLFGSEAKKRGLQLDSYWVDDGWDYLRDPKVADESSLNVWSFDPTQFPNGFAEQKAIAQQYGGSLSVWMSPFGGYGTSAARRQQLNSSKPADKQLETYSGRQFKLSGPRYYEHFKNTIFRMIDNDGVQGFKFDGIGGGLFQTGPSETYRADYEAMLNLATDMRDHNEDVFINSTVGTWGSPYWMWYSDSIWRDGHDAYKVGEGSDQEQYVTYRDAEVYQNFVVESPLTPITQLMNHGFIFSNRAPQFSQNTNLSDLATRKALAADMRGYFAQGFELQELYIRNTLVDPAKIGAENAAWFWDELAKNGKWARDNQNLLADSHWIGGNPNRVDVYGTAAWQFNQGEEKAMFMVRNPSGQPKHHTLDVGKDFELPKGAHGTYRCTERDSQKDAFVAKSGKNYYVSLDPFEVLLFECVESSEAPTDSTEPTYSPEFTKIPKSGWLASANSQETQGENGRASNAIDDNASTIWHTKYQGGIDKLPHTLTVNMGAVNEVHRLTYTPRSGGGGNGRFKNYKIEVSKDGVAWEVVASGEFPDSESTQSIPIPEGKRSFQYFRLEGSTTHNGKEFGAAAEMTAYGVAAPSVYLDRTGWTAEADSQETQGAPTGQDKAIDGDLSTHWHTAYNPSIVKLPHQITLDMKKFGVIDGLRYIPRQDGGTNGIIANYRVETSRDCSTFTVAATGTFQGSAPSLVEFDSTEARCVKLVALTAQNGSEFAGAAEIDVRGKWATATPAAKIEIDDQPGTGNDTYTVPNTPNVRYLINGNEVEPGVHTVPAGTTSILIQAAAEPGYTLAADAPHDYHLEFSVEGGGSPSTSATPGTSASATPGTSASATPGTSASATPGTSASATPGTSASATPGTSASATPGTSASATPGTSASATPGTSASATPGTSAPSAAEVRRLAGTDRVKTAIEVAKAQSWGKTAVLATGRDYADALAAGPLTKAHGAPLLLTTGARLETELISLLREKGFTKVIIVGGTGSVSNAKAQAIQQAGLAVERVAGADRYATAVAVAKATEKIAGERKAVYVVDGTNFPDGVAAGAVAGRTDGIVLFSAGNKLPDATDAYLVGDIRVVGVGGAAVRALTASGFVAGVSMDTVVGATRYETAAKLVKEHAPTATRVVVVSGATFVDSLAGGALAANHDGVLLLSRPESVPPAVSQVISEIKPQRIDVVGGIASLQPKVEQALRKLVG